MVQSVLRFLEEKPSDASQCLKESVIFVVALCFGIFVVEGLLNLLLHQWLLSLFRNNKQLSEKQAHEAVGQAVSRIVGGLHHLVQIPLAIVVLSTPSLAADALFAHNTLSSFMIGFAAAFFWHDLVTCLRRSEAAPYTLHAVICMTVFSYALYSRLMHYYGAAFLLWELSTVFVYVRWILWKLGRSDTKLYVVNGLALLVAFFLCRNVFGIITSCRFWVDMGKAAAAGTFSPVLMWVYRIANWTLNGLNYYWFYKMATQASRIVLGGKKASDVGSDKDE